MQRLRLASPLAAILSLLATIPTRAADPPPFEWMDGDRVVLIGDALIEREQKSGYLETLITLQNPDKTITFRNLGWSGDTVRGIARASFGKPEEGYRQLTQHVLALKPTVIFVGYGMTDSFGGEDGRKPFTEGLKSLLDVLAETRARIVLLSPIKHEDLGRPLPDPVAHNRDLQFCCLEIAKVAGDRGLTSIDLFHLEGKSKSGRSLFLTDDGIHPNDFGYWMIARAVDKLTDVPEEDWSIQVRTDEPPLVVSGTSPKHMQRTPQSVRFETTDRTLPPPPPPVPLSQYEGRYSRRLRVGGLSEGRYTLRIDGKVVTTANAPDWANSVHLRDVPELEQTDRLRQAIIEKNRLYFYRWRPQNETYLFGFRKHEQGNNAREIPLFDPLVEEKEKEIARLKVPATHVYELVREGEEAK